MNKGNPMPMPAPVTEVQAGAPRTQVSTCASGNSNISTATDFGHTDC